MGIKTRMILSFFVVVLLTSALGLYLSYTTTRRYFVEQTRQTLMKLAGVTAKNLDGDVLRNLTVEDQASAAYQAEKDKLRNFRSAVPDARVAYFYRQGQQPSVMELVVDALDPSEELAITVKPEDRYYDIEKNNAPAMREGLAKPSADRELASDEYGVWLSGYAPVFARDGTIVGAFGMDLPAKNIQEGQRELLSLLALSSVAALVVACLVGLFLARAIARPIQDLAEATHVIASGDLEARVKLDRPDEIGALGQDFNKMVGNLQAMATALQGYTTEAIETHEENMAIQLQKVLLPAGDLDARGVVVSSALRPVPWGGGDTYQHWLFGSGDYLMLSYGHVHASGIVACALVTLVQSRLSLLVSNLVLRPGEILAELDRTMRTAAPGLAAMDYFCAVYDLETRWLTIGAAGEAWLFLLRPSTLDLQRLQPSSGPPLGSADTAARYEDEDFEVQAGDRLLVCSAYATEVKNPAGESFGLERLEASIRSHAQRTPAELRQAVLAEIEAFAVTERIGDDLTLLVAQLGTPVAAEAGV